MVIVPFVEPEASEGVKMMLSVQLPPPMRALPQSLVSWKPGLREIELMINDNEPGLVSVTVSGALLMPPTT